MNEKKERALKSIFKGGAIVFMGILASKFLGLLFRVLVGRIGPEEYGVIAVMMSVLSAATTIAYVGVHNGVQKYVAEFRGKDDMAAARGVTRAGLKILTVTSIVVGGTLFIIAPWLAVGVFGEERLIIPLRLAAVAIPFRAYTKIFLSVTKAFERMQYYVYVDRIYVNVAKVGLAVALILLGYGYVGAAFAYTFSLMSAVVLAFYFARKLFPDMLSTSKSATYNYNQLFSHSWPLFAAGLFGIITGKIDTFMLQYFLGSGEVGLYNAAYPFANLMTVGAGMFTGIFLSNASKMISQDRKTDIADSYRATVKWVSIVTVPIFLILVAFPRTALIVFGAEYFAMDNVLRVLALGFLLNALIGPAKQIYQSVDRTRLVFNVSMILGISNVTLNVILIPMYGVMGAALASTTSFALIILYKLYLVRAILDIQPFRRSVFKVWGAGVLAILIVYLVANSLFPVTPVWFFPIALALFSMLYAVFLLIFRTLEEEDIVILNAIQEKTGIESERLENLVRRFS